MKHKKTTSLFLAVVLMLVPVGCAGKNVKVPRSSGAYVGSGYSTVISELQEAGFSNIVETQIEDLTSDSNLSDGAISDISIGGDTDFAEEDAYPKDAEILITYHTIPRKQVPLSSEELESFSLEEIAEQFTSSGFTRVETMSVYDRDPNSFAEEYENEVKIGNISTFEKADEFPFDSDVLVICHMPYKIYNALIHIDFPSNLIFSTYDVDILVDGSVNASLKHGENYDLNLKLKEGEHTLSFEKADDSSIMGSAAFTVEDDMEAKYCINCHSDDIGVWLEYTENKHVPDGQAIVPDSAFNLSCINYQEAVSKLEQAGFTNIKTEAVYDIELGITSEGSVASVKIGTVDDFNRGDVFDADIPIVITYHMDESKDPTKIRPPYNTTTAAGLNYLDVVDAFKKAGFLNIITEDRFRADSEGYKADSVANIYINGNATFDTSDIFDPGAEVRIDYNVIYDGGSKSDNDVTKSDSNSKSDTELTSFYAQKAFEKYGKILYPYGFKCHWILDLINEEQYDDGSWFLKVGVTIENAYGNKIEAVAEGLVSGTDINPEIVTFNVNAKQD